VQNYFFVHPHNFYPQHDHYSQIYPPNLYFVLYLTLYFLHLDFLTHFPLPHPLEFFLDFSQKIHFAGIYSYQGLHLNSLNFLKVIFYSQNHYFHNLVYFFLIHQKAILVILKIFRNTLELSENSFCFCSFSLPRDLFSLIFFAIIYLKNIIYFTNFYTTAYLKSYIISYSLNFK